MYYKYIAVVLLWLFSIILSAILKKRLPKIVTVRKKKKISGKALALMPVKIAVLISILILLPWKVVVGIIIAIAAFFAWTRMGGGISGEKIKKVIYLFNRPPFFIALGVAMINWLIWALNAGFWDFLWQNQKIFWALNITGWLAPCLLLVKGGDGKIHPIAKKFAMIMGGLALVILSIGVLRFSTKEGSLLQQFLAKISTNKPGNSVNFSREIPADVALPIICGCESSGTPGVIKYFEADGKTPLRNKNGSSAISGCQILASVHRARAEAMGFNINTPEGNFGYARVLYNESNPPTKPWEGSNGNTTRSCWEQKLLELQGLREYKVERVAPTGKFGVPVEVIGYNFNWGKSKGPFLVRNNFGKEAKFDPEHGVIENLPYLPNGFSKQIWFKSLSDKPEDVLLELVKQ